MELFEIKIFFTFNCVFVFDRIKWNHLTTWKNELKLIEKY